MSTTVRVSKETKKKLLKYVGKLMKEQGCFISHDYAINELLRKANFTN